MRTYSVFSCVLFRSPSTRGWFPTLSDSGFSLSSGATVLALRRRFELPHHQVLTCVTPLTSPLTATQILAQCTITRDNNVKVFTKLKNVNLPLSKHTYEGGYVLVTFEPRFYLAHVKGSFTMAIPFMTPYPEYGLIKIPLVRLATLLLSNPVRELFSFVWT